MTRRVLAALSAAGIALVACTSAEEVGGLAAPVTAEPAPTTTTPAPTTTPALTTTPAPTTTPARTTTPPPVAVAPAPRTTQVSSTPRAAPAALEVPGWTVAGTRRGLRPGVSVALAVRADPSVASPNAQLAQLVTYRTATGELLDRQPVPDGEFFTLDPQPTARPACDRLAHCVVTGGAGAHSGTASAFAVAPDGEVTLLTHLMATHPTFTAADLDGDGTLEIAAIQSDCLPDCATGSRTWQVHSWTGTAYALTGCAPYQDEPRPPTSLTPCPN